MAGKDCVMKVRIRTWMLTMVLVCAAVIPLAGCDESKQLKPEDMIALVTRIEQASDQIDEAQAIADQIKNLLQTTGVIDANLVAKFEKINEEINRVQPQVQQIAAAIKQADYSPDDDTLMLLLKAAQAGNAASASFNPYAMPIGLGLSLATIIAGWFAARERAKKAQAEAAAAEYAAKYQAHKQGVERTMKEMSASESPEVRKLETKLYDNIGAARKANGVK